MGRVKAIGNRKKKQARWHGGLVKVFNQYAEDGFRHTFRKIIHIGARTELSGLKYTLFLLVVQQRSLEIHPPSP